MSKSAKAAFLMAGIKLNMKFPMITAAANVEHLSIGMANRHGGIYKLAQIRYGSKKQTAIEGLRSVFFCPLISALKTDSFVSNAS